MVWKSSVRMIADLASLRLTRSSDLGSLDDNLTLPIISGALIWVLATIL